MATLRPNWPAGLPSPQALQTATEALRRQYVLPATVLHPVILRQALELGYLLSAYGLVPVEPQTAADQSDIAVDTPRKSSRTASVRSWRRSASQRVPVTDMADDVIELTMFS
jgi:hypothetical protein